VPNLEPESLKIALLTYATKPRGSVVHTLELAEALQQLGHEVCVYALDKDGTGFHRSLSCAVHLIPAATVDGGIDRLIQQRIQEFVDFLGNGHLQAQPYDCYHAQDCISANALLWLRQQGEIAHFVRTVHHIDAFNSPYLQACQEKSILEPDLCLCVSHYSQAELQQQYGVEALRVLNGVNCDRFRPVAPEAIAQLKQRLELSGYPIYLTVGGIEPRKNSIALLQAFAQVLAEYPQAQLVIAGGATLFDYQPYRDAFFAEAADLSITIGESLILPGVIADGDLPTLYQAADAFVFPSLKEGWGLVVLEAIASGLPVLTSNQPPFTEFLSDQQALLVNPHQPEAIAQALLQIIQPHVTTCLMEQSQSLCQVYTWNTSAQLHVEAYRRLTATHSTPLLTYARNSLSD
jgi:glycosyltransferase-like protein